MIAFFSEKGNTHSVKMGCQDLRFLFFQIIMVGILRKGAWPLERRLSSYTGCLLGLAAGDGLGHGPETENGFLPVSAYTQMAAYACNGLLLGLTRGQLSGAMAPPVRYIAMALGEWARLQLWRQEEPVQCWISRSDRMDCRRCSEPGMLDVLTAGELGTMEDHDRSLGGPGALMTAVAVGLFYDPERLPRKELQRLGAEAAALTHGDPSAFLSGAALAHIISRIVWDGEQELERLIWEASIVLRRRFGREYHQARQVRQTLKQARALARSKKVGAEEALAQLGHDTAEQVLAGALYCCLTQPEPAETAARWCPAGAAVAGAIRGALRGEESIPGQRREEIECESVLRELAEDMFRGCPMMLGSRVFDIEWDAKYVSPEL